MPSEIKIQLLSREVTPCPPYIPNERVPYDELRVWLEMHLRDHYADLRALWGAIKWGEFTPGSVIFAGIDGRLTEDNANFFYDDTNNRLGLGTAAPATFLHVLGITTQLRLSFDATKYVNFLVDTNHDLTVKPTSTGQIILQPTTDSTDFFQVFDADGGTPVLDVDSTNERVGIGLALPRDTLEVYQRFITDPILFNTLVGANAGNAITTGNKNTILGYQAGYSATDLSNNVVIGYQANYTEASEGAGGDVIIGYQAGYGLVAGSSPGQNVIIGYQAAYTDREIDSVVIGYQAGYYMSSAGPYGGQYCVYIGRVAGYGGVAGNAGYQNTAVGDTAMTSNTTGFRNVAIGDSALAFNATGQRNIAIGSTAQFGGSTYNQLYCVAIGDSAAYSSRTVSDNVTIGYASLYFNQTGTGNTIVGSNAVRGTSSTSHSGNVVVGAYAGYNFETADNNTICGYYAANQLTDAILNALYGYYSGYYLTTGGSNVFLGPYSGYRQTTDSNLLFIDNQDRGVQNHEPYEALMYGVFAAASGDQDLTFNADVLVRNEGTIGAESLNETDFTTHADWDTTGDFDDTGGNATYIHNTGAGTLLQTAANMVIPGVPYGFYKFTYAVSNPGATGTTVTITTDFAAATVTLPKTLATHTVYFQANSNPGNFVISVTSTGADTFVIDNFSLKQIQGGSMTVNKIMRCKRLLAGGIAA